jgi:antitoxin component of RelBE/YafQ-DinJ toxin-antitoxin module
MNNKKKIEVFVTHEMKEKLRTNAKKSGITMSEVIKRMLEEYLK